MIQRRPFLSLLLSAWLPAWAAAADPRRVIFLQPLGKALPEADVALVKAALSVFYDMDGRVAPRLGLPKAAYYPPRRRCRAE
nr:hypothetical protein [Polyangiaceae bacterium]